MVCYPEDWVPGFVMIPNNLIRSGALNDLNASAFIVWLNLLSREGKDGKVNPGRQRIADDCGLHKDTAKDATNELREAGLLDWIPGNSSKCNDYTIRKGPRGA